MRYLLTTLFTCCLLLAHTVQAQEQTLLKLRDDYGTIYKAKGRLIGNVELEINTLSSTKVVLSPEKFSFCLLRTNFVLSATFRQAVELQISSTRRFKIYQNTKNIF